MWKTSPAVLMAVERVRCERCKRYVESVSYDDELAAEVCENCLIRHMTLVKQFTPWVKLQADTPPEPPWIVKDYIAIGAVTLLTGKPKAGKSTLACAIAEAVDAASASFIGRTVTGGPVVYVSEEDAQTLRPKLSNSSGSEALTRNAAWPKPTWSEVVTAAVTKANDISAVLLVIDSLSFWSSFNENDAEAAHEVMDALGAAMAAGLAVLVVHHQRKAGGGEGDAVRGSGAILSAVDMSIELERLEEDGSTQRRLVAIGRWSAPPVLVIGRNPATGIYQAIGYAESRNGAAALDMRGRIVAALTEEPVTEDVLASILDVDGRKISRPLRDLVDEGRLTRSGEGKKGDPYRYGKCSPKSSPAAGGESPLKCSPPPIGGSISKWMFPVPLGRTGRMWRDGSA